MLLPGRAGIVLAALTGVLAGSAGTSAALAAPPPVRAIKAAYLFKLSPFVDWPANTFVSPADPFRVCIVGDDPFGSALEEAAHGQSAGQRTVSILRLKTAAPESHCQAMYVSGDPQFVSQSLAAVRGTPVLTVTDAQSGDKGIVNFVTSENRVRLEIDQQAALRNHLNVSSKLLDIAVPPNENAP